MPLICPMCAEENSPNAAVCAYCDEPLADPGGPPLTCPMCGEENSLRDAACAFCGEALAGVGSWGSPGVWRDGKTLVMERDAILPDRCVKSNSASSGRLKRKLYWHHPALMVLLLSPIIYIIVAAIVQKRARIEIGLSQRWWGKRRRATLFGWLSVLVAVVLLVMGIAADKGRGNGYLIFGAILLGLFGAIFGLMASRMVHPKCITKTHVWLNGVCPEYLESLPEWRGGS